MTFCRRNRLRLRHDFRLFRRMLHRALLTISLPIALLTLSPAAFSAAVIHSGTLITMKEVASGEVILQRDIARLRADAKADLASARLSLGTARPGSVRTLTGICADTGASDVSLSDSDSEIASFDQTTCAALAAAPITAVVPPAPAAVENIGSASAFGAVPEPSSIVLLALGAAAMLRRRRS